MLKAFQKVLKLKIYKLVKTLKLRLERPIQN